MATVAGFHDATAADGQFLLDAADFDQQAEHGGDAPEPAVAGKGFDLLKKAGDVGGHGFGCFADVDKESGTDNRDGSTGGGARSGGHHLEYDRLETLTLNEALCLWR
ncbi:hypothetical protein J2851_000097 [Azospirillum rugosum]|uniref:Uncharacterized protein n=1 Tax=Azospirillum rugosum TaxID=416170 RepID=A0ABS4SD80_9PROT|nr:hypothetical protein [Azospirillum rugosum]MDQ0527836.1 hypothetical protein [Azospirillum rugosum]